MEAQRDLVPADLNDTPNVVLCVVPDATSLRQEAEKLHVHGVRFKLFTEPDIPAPLPQETALATEPIYGAARRVFRHLKTMKETSR